MLSFLRSSSTSQIQLARVDALGFLEATRGDRRRADAQAGGHERRSRIVRHRVLVDRDVRAPERGFRVLAGDVLADQVDEEQVVLGAAGDDLVAALDASPSPSPARSSRPAADSPELRLHRFLEGAPPWRRSRASAGRPGCRGTRSSAVSFRSSCVRARDDHAAARSAQGLVRGRWSRRPRCGTGFGYTPGGDEARRHAPCRREIARRPCRRSRGCAPSRAPASTR